MASVTYWSQLQPSARAQSIAEGLAARIRDPAWLLCRQWQVGEFQGVDGGSPAFTRIGSHTAKLESATLGSSKVKLAPSDQLEPVVEAEPLGTDLATRVEIGQTFESLVPAALRKKFRDAYPIDAAGSDGDPRTARFLAICAGRAVDGVELYTAAKAAQRANKPLPAKPALPAASRPAATKAVAAFIKWVETTWGTLGDAEPPAWNATHLDYRASVSAGKLNLDATPDPEGALDWYAFDLVSGTPPTTSPSQTSVMPGHVRFRGMPNARWWDFETSKTDFGAILPDPRDLAKLLFADFLLLHGDDWFLAPLDVPAGSLCWVDSLTVTDVFGATTSIPRAEAGQGTRWTLFSTTDQGSRSTAPFLLVPASAAASALTGSALEEVHLLRDETADMAWAIEHVVEGPTGAPQLEPPPPPPVPVGAPAPLVYQLQSPLPTSWFPLMPVATPTGAVALVAGTVEDGPSAPSSRLVKRLSASGFELPEEEIGRSGVRLERIACRTRSSDGSARLWVARRRHIGAGEASSGLRYDEARPTDV